MIHERESTKMDVKRMRVRKANENPPKAVVLHMEDVGETGFAVAEENGDDAGQFLDCLSFEGCRLVAESFNPSSGCGKPTIFVSKADSGPVHDDSGGLSHLLTADYNRVGEDAFDHRCPLSNYAYDLNDFNSQKASCFSDEGADYGATTTMNCYFSNWVREANENTPKAALSRVEEIGETTPMAPEENGDDDVGQFLYRLSFEGCGEVAESFYPSTGCVKASLMVNEIDSDRVHHEDFESFVQLLAADDNVLDYCCPSSTSTDIETPSYNSNDLIPTKKSYPFESGSCLKHESKWRSNILSYWTTPIESCGR